MDLVVTVQTAATTGKGIATHVRTLVSVAHVSIAGMAIASVALLTKLRGAGLQHALINTAVRVVTGNAVFSYGRMFP